MATTFTHAYLAGLISTTAPKELPIFKIAVLAIIFSILPDIDVIAFKFNIPYEHPFGHRGITHSISFALVTAILGTCLFYKKITFLDKKCIGLFFIFFIATLSHGVLDALTDAGKGIGFFIPFSEARYFFPWRPLETSPIGIQQFFSGPFFSILKIEFLYIWLPTSIIFVIVKLIPSLYKKVTAR